MVDNDTCLICRAVYPQGGQQTGVPWGLWVATAPGTPQRKVCRRCVEAGRDARREAERDAAAQAVYQGRG